MTASRRAKITDNPQWHIGLTQILILIGMANMEKNSGKSGG